MTTRNFLLTLALAGSAFFAGYQARVVSDKEIHAAFVEGQRDTAAYVEDCTLVRAQAGQCAIPCSDAADCVAKNGRGDAY